MHLSREGKCLFLSKKRGKLDLSKEMSADVEQLEESARSQDAGRNIEQVQRGKSEVTPSLTLFVLMFIM